MDLRDWWARLRMMWLHEQDDEDFWAKDLVAWW